MASIASKQHTANRPSGLQTIAERETRLLAPYAMHSKQSAGREYGEDEHPYRGPYQRDRDRILHSAAFRRLSGKTQVFTGEMGDYHRTRLTHTHEVASIARTIGRALRLNEDLIEALALCHDLGHPPYGHAGEAALNECLADQGGFSHNRHALTLVRELEQRYHGFPGLNLTREVLDSQATRVDKQGSIPLLEAQVVDVADSITYDAHDTDDALELGFVTLDQLGELPMIRRLLDQVRSRSSIDDEYALRRALVHELIDDQVSDILRTGSARLGNGHYADHREAQRAGLLVAPSPELAAEKQELESFLYRHVYRHRELLRVRHEAQERLRSLFSHLLDHPRQLPPQFRQRSADVGLPRAAGEYLAGLTDRGCDQCYEQR